MNGGRISVVIPVFNTEQFLADAIESALAQDEQPLEIIVVDDGSTDGSAAVAEGFGPPVRVIRQTNGGPAAARNRGLKAARGEYIAFLDADDLFSPDKFTLQAGRLDRRPEIDIVLGQKRYLGLEKDGDAFRPIEQSDDHLVLSLGACVIRRRAFDRVGLPDETLRHCDDWDWFMRAREIGVPMLLHRHVVLQYRLHTANITRDRESGARFTLEVMRRSLARRRGRGAAAPLPPLASFLEPEDAPS